MADYPAATIAELALGALEAKLLVTSGGASCWKSAMGVVELTLDLLADDERSRP